MLREIHTWLVENLKDKPSDPQNEANSSLDLFNASRQADLQFALYEERLSGMELVCSHASLHSTWNEKRIKAGTAHIAPSQTLFQCKCDNQAVLHAADVDAFCCELTSTLFLLLKQLSINTILNTLVSHLTFALRLAGKQRAWMLYKTANKTTNKMVSLIIKNIPASCNSLFLTSAIYKC
jgi:hypothetical protein